MYISRLSKTCRVAKYSLDQQGHACVTVSVIPIEIIDIECGLLSLVSQNIVATKWQIYKMAKLACPRTFCAKGTGSIEENPNWPIYKGKFFFCKLDPCHVTEHAFYI